MRRATIVLVTALAAIPTLLSAAATAKGAESATLIGPGLDKPIDYSNKDANDSATDTGLYSQFSDNAPGETARPQGPLGPRYVITYTLNFGRGNHPKIVQHIYPYAPAGSWVFTPEQKVDKGFSIGGVWTPGSTFLVDGLIDVGLPRKSPVPIPDAPTAAAPADVAVPDTQPQVAPAAPRDSTAPAPQRTRETPWLLVITIAAGVIAGGVWVLTRSRRLLGRPAS
jgi:hypothetical protein